tara:strand:+ start:1296 stop:1658 length:363 start_codon:yes stop_codon:yes gene_type:complete
MKICELFKEFGTGVQIKRGKEQVTCHAITPDGYAMCTNRAEGVFGMMAVFESFIDGWERDVPTSRAEQYLMQSTTRHRISSINPMLVLAFPDRETADAYAMEHDYKILKHVMSLEIQDAE